MDLKELNLSVEEISAMAEIFKNGKVLLPVYRRIADKFLNVAQSNIEKTLNEMEKEMKKFMIDKS